MGRAGWVARNPVRAYTHAMAVSARETADHLRRRRAGAVAGVRALLDVEPLRIPSVREPLLSRATVRRLHELRSFRHFLHHGYGAELDPVRLETLQTGAIALRPQLDAELDSLDGRLAEIAALGD